MTNSSLSQVRLRSGIIISRLPAMSSHPSASSSLRVCPTRLPIAHLCSNSLNSHTKFFRSLFWRRSVIFQKITTKTHPPPYGTASASGSMDLQPVEELPPKLQEIIKLFQSVQEPKAKYEQLLFYGKNLKPLDVRYKTRENKVEGCVSQVWVRAFLDQEDNVVYEADSDSILTKGLAALLVQSFSGRPVAEILRVSPDFVVQLGLQQSLTPSRNNGFLNMLKLMQKKALQLVVDAGGPDENSISTSETAPQADGFEEGYERLSDYRTDGVEPGATHSDSNQETADSDGLGGRGVRIREKLKTALAPVELIIEDISHQHAGHAGVQGLDGETHFNLRVISKEFEGKSLVKRHRLIYDLLQDELQTGLHALSIVAKTPTEMGV